MPCKPTALVLVACCTFGASAADRGGRYALILADPPLASMAATRDQLRGPGMAAYRNRIDAMQSALKAELAGRNIPVLGSTSILLNAVYVAADDYGLAGLQALPGVIRVEKMKEYKRHLNRASNVMNVPAAWNTLGGQQNAGLGVKIGIADTGIDQTHPAFQDAGLPIPAGFPKCNVAADCAYTNRKVIVARSYVAAVAGGPPEFTRPDDISPRDRDGHGTASAMIAAGATVKAPAATITGIAPKAYLGNYKIYGSPSVNGPFTFGDVVLQALEDALSDGMDVVSLLLGTPARFDPNDRGCSGLCDTLLDAVLTATRLGLTVVVSAGNDGDLGYFAPMLGSIESPGIAPDAITVGSIVNSHSLFSSVRLSGAGVPAGLQKISAWFGSGTAPANPLTAPLRDVSQLGDNGKACSPLTNSALAGSLVLVQRGDCTFATKAANVLAAGGAGMIVVTTSDFLFPMTGLTAAGIPAVMIGATDGAALQSFLSSRPGSPAALDPALTEVNGDTDIISGSSSYGPATFYKTIKPELVAVGTDLYTAAQNYDPNGELYDPSRFTTVGGTSFAGSIVAGAVALVKQTNPGFTPAQLKSAVVNTANPIVSDFDANNNFFPARVTAIGAGKLDAGAAVQSSVQVNPSTLSFGVIGTTLPAQNLTITNSGRSAVTLQLAVSRRDADSRANLTLSSSSVTVAAGASTTVTARLQGVIPAAGSYEGAITIQGGPVSLRVPYLYIVTDGIPYNASAVLNDGFEGLAGSSLEVDVKVVDQFGAAVPNLPVRFYSTLGGGRISSGTPTTDSLGVAYATAVLGPQLGPQQFAVDISNPPRFTIHFDGVTRAPLTIGSVVNAASGQSGRGLAPGSYITIFGSGLSDLARGFNTPYLPVGLANVSVSFDIPSKNISVPGRLSYVSASQVNLQVPWELQGQSSAAMKVSLGGFSSPISNVTLNDYSPALFEYTEAGTGRLLAAAEDSKFALIGTNHPALRGDTVQLFANGLGPVDNQPPSGEATQLQPLARTRVVPNVTIGGQTAPVTFSGLTPQSIGLYQINVVVPANLSAGLQTVVVTQNGVVAKTSQLPVQ